MDFDQLMKRDEALKRLFASWEITPQEETVTLDAACRRILTKDQRSQHSLPVVRASAMDGIAVSYDRFLQEQERTTEWALNREYVRADTGDDFDDAYDTVIPIEKVTFTEHGGVVFPSDLKVTKGMNVRGAGSSLKKGVTLVKAGTKLRPQDLAVLATGGITQVPVIKKPKVAFIPTGTELVPAGTVPQRGQNINSNSILAKYMLEEMGAEPVSFPIVRDQETFLRRSLKRALEMADFVIINGGSSKGGEDFNTKLLRESGDLLYHGVAAVPGRPMGAAIIGGKAVVNLAGPSMAAFYGLDWIIREMVCHWLGIGTQPRPTAECILTKDLPTPPFLERLVLLQASQREDGTWEAVPKGRDDDSPAMSANAMLISELGSKGYKAGDKVTVQLLV